MKKYLIILSLLTLNLEAAESGANPRNARERHQEKRIKNGVKSGELSKKETRRLVREQKKIDHFQKKAASDGTITDREKHKLKRMQKRASRDIWKQKHDDDKKGNSSDASSDEVSDEVSSETSAETEE